MATTTITVQEAVNTGLEAVFETATSLMQYAHPGQPHIIVVKNGAVESILTIDSQVNCNQDVDHDKGGTIEADEERHFGNIKAGRFKDANGNVQLAFDDVTNLTIAVIKTA